MQTQEIPFGRIHYLNEWGSNHKDHRLKLRNFLFTQFNDPNLLDLNQTPKLTNLSVSHCKEVGGFFISERKYSGFDFENRERLSSKLILRISTKKERDLFNKSDFLIWSIKESGFKAFSKFNSEIKTISEITITDYNQEINTGEVQFKSHTGTFYTSSLNSSVLFASVVSDGK